MKGLLRFLTCGSVDDGKSTLIGRMLYDAQMVFDDQLAALQKDTIKHGTTGEAFDFALLVDGLEAEREQGITIDVAYRYFSTPKRAFIVADTPGHEQYTRNMATGASTADLAVLLVDARKGLLPQTYRHATICSLLGIRHVLLAVNKMDLVDYDPDVFAKIESDFARLAARLGFASVQAIPVAARYGENIAHRSSATRWYNGPSLLEYLETVDIDDGAADLPFRFPVQWVNRPNLDFRGFSGTIASGVLKAGDAIRVATSGVETQVTRIVTHDGDLEEAQAGDAVTLVLQDEVDIARGDMLARPSDLPECANQFTAHLVWMSDTPLMPGRVYAIRIGTKMTRATVTALKHRIDVTTSEPLAAKTLGLNDIGVVDIETGSTVAFDPYQDNRRTGAFILVDRETNATVAAGMVMHGLRRATNVHMQSLTTTKEDRARIKYQKPAILWFTGLSGAGKSTIANAVERKLHALRHHTTMLDGDNLRHGLNKDLGFTAEDRVENIRRAGEVARLMTDAGLIVLCSFISPYRAERQAVRDLVSDGEFLEVFVDAPLELCIARDPKGLYGKALAGQIPNFTGVNAPYETPEQPEIHLHTAELTPEQAADIVVRALQERGIIEHG